MYSTGATNIGNFMCWLFENGILEKIQDMITWQRYEIWMILQLRQVKDMSMDLVPLLLHGSDGGGDNGQSDTLPPLGILYGICGGEEDARRAEKIICNSGILYATPLLLQRFGSDLSSNADDNRSGAVECNDIPPGDKKPELVTVECITRYRYKENWFDYSKVVCRFMITSTTVDEEDGVLSSESMV